MESFDPSILQAVGSLCSSIMTQEVRRSFIFLTQNAVCEQRKVNKMMLSFVSLPQVVEHHTTDAIFHDFLYSITIHYCRIHDIQDK